MMMPILLNMETREAIQKDVVNMHNVWKSWLSGQKSYYIFRWSQVHVLVQELATLTEAFRDFPHSFQILG
jgi:hypothetical protein